MIGTGKFYLCDFSRVCIPLLYIFSFIPIPTFQAQSQGNKSKNKTMTKTPPTIKNHSSTFLCTMYYVLSHNCFMYVTSPLKSYKITLAILCEKRIK